MGQAEAPGVQEHPFQTLAAQRLVPSKIAVFVITRQRKTQMGQMDPDLVRPAGVELGFEQTERRGSVWPGFAPEKYRACDLAAGSLDAHAPLAATRDKPGQW